MHKGFVALAGVAIVIIVSGHQPDNSIPANPLVTPHSIVPEWYFLPFYNAIRGTFIFS